MMFTRLLGVGREGGQALFSRISRFSDSDFHMLLLHTRVAAHPAMVFAFLSAVCLSPLFHKRLQHFICSASQARLFFQSQLFKAKNWYLKLSITEPMIDFCLSKSHDMTRTLRFLSNTPNYFSKKSWTMMVEIGFAKKKTDKALIV